MKLAIIYDSKTGNTKQAGDWIVFRDALLFKWS